MFLRMLLLLLTLVPISQNLQAGLWDNLTGVFGSRAQNEIPSIRVLLLHNVEAIDLEVKGKYSLYDPYANAYLSSRYVGKRKKMQAMNDGLKWGEAFPGLYQLKITPDELETITTIDNKNYLGPIYVYDVGGTISVVNQIPVEDYVQAMLSNYDTHGLQPETIAALAIVTRTNAYYQAVNPRTNFWAVDAQKNGFKGTSETNVNTANAEDAARLTRNMIMSNTGIYEGRATPFLAELGPINPGHSAKNVAPSQISLEEANSMAQNGAHAAQILGRAFPGSTIMLSQ